MNIFILDYNPIKAAKMHCDKHSVKMVTELYQQLGSALRRHGASDKQMPLTKSGKPLKGGYHNHPCTIWCGENRDNFMWAINHAKALVAEYTLRYKKVHYCKSPIYQMEGLAALLPKGSQTPFALAMPKEYQADCAVESYRRYYWFDKRLNIDCSWKKCRAQPYWFSESYFNDYNS